MSSDNPGRGRPDASSQTSEYVAPTLNALAVVAIVGAVLGILGLLPLIGSVVGIVCGRLAQRQIAERGQDGGPMARIAVIMGWVGLSLALLVILFVAVLIATASAPQ